MRKQAISGGAVRVLWAWRLFEQSQRGEHRSEKEIQ